MVVSALPVPGETRMIVFSVFFPSFLHGFGTVMFGRLNNSHVRCRRFNIQPQKSVCTLFLVSSRYLRNSTLSWIGKVCGNLFGMWLGLVGTEMHVRVNVDKVY